MAYIGVSPSNGVRQKHTYTATASQTTFSGAGSEGISLSYRDSNYVDVYVNGVKLGDADYTATSGTSIVLGVGAAVNDIVEIITYDVFSVADTVSKADGGTFDGNVAMAGTLAVTGDITGTLATAAQTNITSVGTLSSVTVNGTGTSNFTSTATSPVQINGTSIPTLTVRNSTTPVELQMRATTGEGLVRTSTNHPLTFAVNASEKMRIDSSGNVGIGTTSPSATLHLDSGGTPTTIQIDSDTEASIDFNDHGGSAKRYKIGTNISSNSGQLEFKDMTANSERMRISSNGHVSVGTTDDTYGFNVGGSGSDVRGKFQGSNQYRLGLQNGTNDIVWLGSGGANNFRISNSSGQTRFEIDSSGNMNVTSGNVTVIDGQGYYFGDGSYRIEGKDDGSNARIGFVTGSSEAMRIDSSGNLLVGTTETVPGIANTTSGISLRGGSGAESIVVSRGGGISGYFNRNSDGAILQLRKDGSAVGSIGTAGGGAFYISDSTYGGLGFSTLGAGDINPVNTTGGIRDNAMDLGQPTARFKDLYLSGGVYLGGTGSANKLDDYEEGTWNPSLTPSNGSFTSITYQSRDGRYTKIGNIVTISCRLSTTSITVGAGSGNVQITNLPFNTSSSSAPGSALSFNANWASGNPAFAFLLDLSGTVRLHQSVAAGAYNLGTPTTVANLNTGSNNSNYVYFVLTYETT